MDFCFIFFFHLFLFIGIVLSGDVDINSVSPGMYRIIGAEGEASLAIRARSNATNPLFKVAMTYWNGSPNIAQEWILGSISNDTSLFSLANSHTNENVLSRRESNSNFRIWKIQRTGTNTWQLRDIERRKCLTRLGVTVYDDGSPCDSQAQSQRWIFILLKKQLI